MYPPSTACWTEKPKSFALPPSSFCHCIAPAPSNFTTQ